MVIRKATSMQSLPLSDDAIKSVLEHDAIITGFAAYMVPTYDAS